MAGKKKIRVRLQSYDHALLDEGRLLKLSRKPSKVVLR